MERERERDKPIPLDPSWPAFLSIQHSLGVVICSIHGCAYARDGLGRHLSRGHTLKKQQRESILAVATREATLAPSLHDVQRPTHYHPYISGLPLYDAYLCDFFNSDGCEFISTHIEAWKEHHRKTHHIFARPELGALARQSHVKVQSLSAARHQRRYFIVVADGRQLGRSDDNPSHHQDDHDPTTAASLQQRFHQVVTTSAQGRYDTITSLDHVSELSSWFRETGFHTHLEGLRGDDLPHLYSVPSPRGSDTRLLAISESVDRVLRRGLDLLDHSRLDQEQLSRHDARLINTFQPGTISQDPIRPLQNMRSRRSYVHIMQQLVCYFARVTEIRREEEDERASHPTQETRFFQPTTDQAIAWGALHDATERLDREEEGGSTCRLDRATLVFLVSLIEQKVPGRKFDSAMLSFVAVISWSHRAQTWLPIGHYTSYLSRIVYCCQMVAVVHCRDAVRIDDDQDFSDHLVDFRDRWMLSDTRGPMADILSWRLLGEATAQHIVPEALIRWSADGEEVTCRAISLSMHDLRGLVDHELRAATDVLQRDLLLGLRDRPTISISDICDNWADRRPGASFLTEGRNTAIVADCQSWIHRGLLARADLAERFYERDDDRRWCVQATAAKQYAHATQRFLEHLMVLIHIGSGQPARRPELVGLRWCNRQAEPRNLLIHDGQVIFILSYHKSLNVTYGSRFPVRTLAPAIADLLISYLLFVVPFNIYLSDECGRSSQYSEYLWSTDGKIWSEDRVTEIFASESQAAIGKRLTIQAWRQMAVGIAMRKLKGDGYDPSDEHAGAASSDDENEGPMPEALHWQAAHTPRVGHRAYGNTINFHAGLTDAGLQEYIRVSRRWHRFLRIDQPASSRKRQRPSSGDGDDDEFTVASLPDRLAAIGTKRGCRRHWSMGEVRIALHHIFGPSFEYRSSAQEKAVQSVSAGLTPILAVLSTGGGKSLLYMLQQRLPGAGTTVLLVPLVALKQDTIRRCRAIGVECRLWDESPSSSAAGGSLVIVSVDQAVRSVRFRAYLRDLDVAGQLGSIVIDECHLVLTAAGYRKSMQQVRELRGHKCQQIFLTATLPPSMYHRLTEHLLLPDLIQIRGATTRQDLQYIVRQIPSDHEFVPTVVAKIQQRMSFGGIQGDAHARVIVYCGQRAEVEAVASALGCPFYHSSSGTEADKLEVLTSWIDGRRGKVIVATSAFGAGIDHGSVRMVVHIGPPPSAIDFAQEIGRAGRDGQGGTSLVYLRSGWRARTRDHSGELLDLDQQVMQRYLDSPRCRRAVLEAFLDGGSGRLCGDVSPRCDRCRAHALAGEEKSAPTWHVATTTTAQETSNPTNLTEEGRHPQVTQQAAAGGEPTVDDRTSANNDDDDEIRALHLGESIDQGPQHVQTEAQQQARKRRAFIQQLETVQGLCMICLVQHGDGSMAHHSLASCTRKEKWMFFDTRRELKSVAGGWIERYAGCFRCGLSQTICQEQGGRGCRFSDVVVPLCWSGYSVSGRWRSQLLRALSRGESTSLRDFMVHLGRGRQVFGEQSSGLVMVASLMLGEILGSRRVPPSCNSTLPAWGQLP